MAKDIYQGSTGWTYWCLIEWSYFEELPNIMLYERKTWLTRRTSYAVSSDLGVGGHNPKKKHISVRGKWTVWPSRIDFFPCCPWCVLFEVVFLPVADGSWADDCLCQHLDPCFLPLTSLPCAIRLSFYPWGELESRFCYLPEEWKSTSWLLFMSFKWPGIFVCTPPTHSQKNMALLTSLLFLTSYLVVKDTCLH